MAKESSLRPTGISFRNGGFGKGISNFEKAKEIVAARRKAAVERAATIAERAGWDAVWAAANPRGLKSKVPKAM